MARQLAGQAPEPTGSSSGLAKLPPGRRAASSEIDASDGRVDGRHSWSRGKGRPDGSPRLLPVQMLEGSAILVSSPQAGRDPRAPSQEPRVERRRG